MNNFYSAVPFIQTAFEAGEANLRKNSSGVQLYQSFPGRTNVAVHIREGDTASRLKPVYFAATMAELQREADKNATLTQKPIHFWIHTNGEGYDRTRLLENLTRLAKRIPGGLPLNHSGFSMSLVSAAVSLSTAMLQMIHSDIFVMSRSSLSYAVALYRNSDKRTLYPDCENGHLPMPHYERRECDVPESDRDIERCPLLNAETCSSEATAEGYKIGFIGSLPRYNLPFVGEYTRRGCFVHIRGALAGIAFFGTGGAYVEKVKILHNPYKRIGADFACSSTSDECHCLKPGTR
jgi:hypothetical protein